jgi:hypothetical protein
MATNQLEIVWTQASRLPPAELAQLIKRAADVLAQQPTPVTPPAPCYVALFGSGRGLFADPAEVDRFLREERDAWDE